MRGDMTLRSLPLPSLKPKASAKTKLRLDAFLPFRLSVASNEVSRLISRAYEDRFGLTVPQWRLVTVLAESGPLMQQEIGVRTIMDKVTVSRAAQGLLHRHLLERLDNTSDGRSHLLALTKVGEELYFEVAPIAQAFEAAVLDQWAPEEIEQLNKQLQRLQRTAAELARQGFCPRDED
jgi:DNA-binding MarR family transcriptional regulator